MNDERKMIYSHDDYINLDYWKTEAAERFECDVEDISDMQGWEEAAFSDEIDYSDACALIQEAIGDLRVIGVGTAELWTGPADGGFIARDFSEAISKICGRDSGEWDFYEENGALWVAFHHHDGATRVHLKTITYEGEDLIMEHEYDLDISEQELHRILVENDGGEYTQEISVL